MLNVCVLIGRLVRDPEIRYTTSGDPVSNFAIAVDRPFTGADGKRDADFIEVVCWRKLAESVSEHLTKGRLVAVEGRLQIRSYEAKDGQRRKVAEVVAATVRFLDRGEAEDVAQLFGGVEVGPLEAEEPPAAAASQPSILRSACEDCGAELTDRVAAYSQDRYGRLLCYKHQPRRQEAGRGA